MTPTFYHTESELHNLQLRTVPNRYLPVGWMKMIQFEHAAFDLRTNCVRNHLIVSATFAVHVGSNTMGGKLTFAAAAKASDLPRQGGHSTRNKCVHNFTYHLKNKLR